MASHINRGHGPADPFIAAAQLTDIEPVADGLENIVFKATSPHYGPVALRVPRHRTFVNVNDPNIDAANLLNQELRIYKLLRQAGVVPVPQPFELLQVNDGSVAMLSEYVEADGSTALDAEMGRMAALIHTVDLPLDWDVQLVAMDGYADVFTTLVNRMLARFRHFAEAEPSSKSWIPSRATLEQIADKLRQSLPSRRHLLHMDIRDVNLRVQHGKIVAVIDWNNALVGPPAVDFYRVTELVRPGPDFAEAYIAAGAELPTLATDAEAFLRLDAALMLSLVFISEAPDATRRASYVARVEELAKSLL